MDQLTIRQGAEVRSSDDEKLGKVVALEGDFVVVEKGWLFPSDHYIPTSAISSADDETVYLSVTKDMALNSGWDQATAAPVADTGYADASYAAPETPGYAGTEGRGDPEATGTIGAGFDAAGADASVPTNDVLRIPVHEEELTARTRPVEQGEVRVETDVVAEERSIDVPVTEERVRITRRVVDRDAGPDAAAFEETTIDVPLRGEAVEVEKRVRVAEEIEVAKEAVQRTERVTGTVRHEEVRVDDSTVVDDGVESAR